MRKLLLTLLISVLCLTAYTEYVSAAWGGEGAWGSIVNYLKVVGTHIIPSVDSTFDLGSTAKKWKNAYIDTTFIGDGTFADATPSLGFKDTDSNVGYMFHLESGVGAAPFQNFQLWRGTYVGANFNVNPDVPLMWWDNSNLVHVPYGLSAGSTSQFSVDSLGNVDTTGTLGAGATTVNTLTASGEISSASSLLYESLIAKNAYFLTNENTPSYAYENLVTYNGNQYIAYWDTDSHLVVGKRSGYAVNSIWTFYTYDGTGGRPDIALVSADSHRVISMEFDSDGYCHIGYGMHADALNYRRSSASEDISNFGATLAMLGTNETAVSYPIFLKNGNDLYFMFRDGDSTSSDVFFYKYNPATTSWGATTGAAADGLIINGKGTPVGTYLNGIPQFDSSGDLHITWAYRNAGAQQYNLYYVKWNGTSFEKYGGAAQTIPITPVNNTEVVTIVASAAYYNQNHFALDSNNNIYQVYVKDDTSANSQYYLSYTSGGIWATKQLTDFRWGSGLTYFIPRPEIIINSTNDIFVIYTNPLEKQGIAVLESRDLGATWKKYYINSSLTGYTEINKDQSLWSSSGIVSIVKQASISPWGKGPRSPNISVVTWKPLTARLYDGGFDSGGNIYSSGNLYLDGIIDVASASSSIVRAGLTVNDDSGGGVNDDFIAETNTYANAFQVDASADEVWSRVNTRIQPTVDSDAGFQILDADGGVPVLNVDTTNERVGIGTSSPGYPLEIVTPGTDAEFRLRSDQATDVIANLVAVSWGGVSFGARSNHLLQLVSNNTVRAVFAANGNSGIGTDATPDYFFDVQGNLHTDGNLSVDGNLITIGKTASTKIDKTLGVGVTTFAITNDVIKLTGDGGGNTIATITGGISGQVLTLLFVDALVTITDTAAATADTVNLSAAFTGSADDTLTLIYDGNKWFEVARSVN